jgi:ATP-dependent Lhr-like helicase
VRTVEETIDSLDSWFKSREWESFPFQRKVWREFLEGKSGLIHSATGTGKTLAAWLGPLASGGNEGLQVLWITPLRALAGDTALSLQMPLQDLRPDWRVEIRTGDTTSSERVRQRLDQPQALVTTPESLSLMLSYPDWEKYLSSLRVVIVDEWHELMSTKRGVQTELALARLRHRNPGLQTWGISATLGNLDEAMAALLGSTDHEGILVQGEVPKEIIIDSLIPDSIERFPWAGHMNTRMLPQVVEAIETSNSCLLFTNTRSQAELWFQAILDARPDWAGVIELHHGSLDRDVRTAVENGLKTGLLRAVVCTSSLDLGVDFTPVDRVLQIGSPKGVARLLQRAGRSGHRPGIASRVSCVPTNALEFLDVASAREAAQRGEIEGREEAEKPLDVLVQHVITIASGGGFEEGELFREVKSAHAYRNLTAEEWEWVLSFTSSGGASLQAYDNFKKVGKHRDEYLVRDAHVARQHRMSIGTIVSDAAMTIQYLKGGKLGTVEESFIARLRPGDKFLFGGRPLEFVRQKDMVAWVRRSSSTSGTVPRWMGSRLPLSGKLAAAIRRTLDRIHDGELGAPELEAIAPLLEVQQRWSAIPRRDDFLIERVQSREGHHIFFYPIEGRLVHEGLAALFGFRLSRLTSITFSLAYNDYGLELLSPDPAPLEQAISEGLLSPENLSEDIAGSLNAVEMSRRQFREIARISGLVFDGYPSQRKTARQLQGSSGLFFDVFSRYEPDNLLLQQSFREVLEKQLEHGRMLRALERLSTSNLVITEPPAPTPFAFPILVDRFRESVSSQSISERIDSMSLRLERAADD